MLDRAYATIQIKSVDDDQRVIEGIASTPEVDRVGDIVESKGAQFKLPMPLLWQHRADQPIGHVLSAIPSATGIKIRAQIAKGLLPEIDRAWALIKSGLVAGLSIGFKPLEMEPLNAKDPWGGQRIKLWEWLELSAVTIPANATAAIHTIKELKSLDAEALAASGRSALSVRSSTSPGATGRSSTGTIMNVSERLTARKAELQTKNARMQDLMKTEVEDGLEMSAEQKSEYDRLAVDSQDLTEQIGRLSQLEQNQAALSKGLVVGDLQSGSGARVVRPHVEVKSNLPPGQEFVRFLICKMAAHISGGAVTAMEVAKARYPDNPRIQTYIKAAITGGTTTDSTWAGPLVYAENLGSEFIEYLRPKTILGQFGQGNVPSLRRVPFNVRVIGQTSGGTAGWVGQEKQKPVTKFDVEAVPLYWAKLAAIIVISQELARFSSPSAESLVRDELSAAIVELMDRDFIDPAKSVDANVSPASITNTGVDIGSPSGTDADAVRADLTTLLNAYLAANNPPDSAVLIMPSTIALAISMMTNALGQPEFPNIGMKGGSLKGIPVIASQYAAVGSPPSNLVIMVNASDIFLADDGGVSIDVSREASIEMSDDPENDTGTVVNMFQTNQIALRAERFVNWAKRRAGAVQYMDDVAWAP